MALNIIDNCYACCEPVFDVDEHTYKIPHGGDWDELFHSECAPSQFFVEEEDVYGFDT